MARTTPCDKSPGDVQVLWAFLKKFPSAVGTVSKNKLAVNFLNSTHSTWTFLGGNAQHLNVTWTFIARRGSWRLFGLARLAPPARGRKHGAEGVIDSDDEQIACKQKCLAVGRPRDFAVGPACVDPAVSGGRMPGSGEAT